jgi:hypothetical protein
MPCSADDEELEQELLQALEEGSESDSDQIPSGTSQAAARKRPALAAAVHPASLSNEEAGLPGLPAPVLLRVLSHLSPEELCVAAATCHSLRHAAHDTALWRALYLARWQPAVEDAAGDGDRLPGSWKARYHERDEAEVQAQLERAPLRELYLQMATAKRSEKLSPAQREGLFAAHASDAPGAMSVRVAAFRRHLGLPDHLDAGDSAPFGGTRCAGGCSFVELDATIWICSRGGEVHVCGDACSERETDAVSTLPVCRITGRCFVHEFEEGDAGGAAARDDAAAAGGDGDDWNEQEGTGGRLGRAFLAGYNAADEHEMLRRFGVKL